MSDKRKAEEVVKDLLESFRAEDAPIVETRRTEVRTASHDFVGMATPEDMAAICSIFMSLFGTAVSSTISGYADNMLNTAWPHIRKEMLGHYGVEEKHLKLVHELIEGPIRDIAREDMHRPPSEQRVPIALEQSVDTMIQFGLAMFTLGKQQKPLNFGGFKAALYKCIMRMLAAGGIDPNKGTVSDRVRELVIETVDRFRKEEAIRKDFGEQDDG